MTLQALLEATEGHAPGYTGAARDCLLEAATCREDPVTWIATAQVFATLALAEALTTSGRGIGLADVAAHIGDVTS